MKIFVQHGSSIFIADITLSIVYLYSISCSSYTFYHKQACCIDVGIDSVFL